MLLDEIITLLGDDKSSLNAALLKTKILLHQIGKKELVEWVNNELNGYSDKATVPEYRVLHSEVRANAASVAWQFTDHPIPIAHLEDSTKENLTKAPMTQSLAVLEDMCAKDGGFLKRDIPMEFNGVLSKPLAQGVKIQSAWCVTSIHDVKGILTQVRSRLLDFVLELKSSMGDVMSDEQVKKEAAKVDSENMFNNAVFGHNTTIVVGSHNTQNIKNKVEAGNLDSLVKALSDAGIPAADIDELKTAIAEDEATEGKASFDGKTGNWLTRTMGKISNGTIKLGSEVAGHVIAAAISSYIGIGHGG